ncbi:hypothetical protein DAPPUDRAFT_67989 [Daphnia pulex]|uniref:Uncharacterized protein n=1 Tax=Daphnia pulex TaxID=6669 RepID=E9I0P9_DAPPU|nr:hypothetical protein DAPPUDRAFT_67989 [Daphnia pulex]|eukprot:EFX62431.1 hypothetical protein DAPPUDRAFT_67989 [Daphnia pulex]
MLQQSIDTIFCCISLPTFSFRLLQQTAATITTSNAANLQLSEHISVFFLIFSYNRIDDLFHVKLTDMVLSRDFFPNDYHCLGDNENRPIK